MSWSAAFIPAGGGWAVAAHVSWRIKQESAVGCIIVIYFFRFINEALFRAFFRADKL